MTQAAVVVLTPDELRQLVTQAVAEALADQPAREPAREVLSRREAAAFLGCSLTQLDRLCHPRQERPLPYSVLGDSRRFYRAEILEWLRASRPSAAEQGAADDADPVAESSSGRGSEAQSAGKGAPRSAPGSRGLQRRGIEGLGESCEYAGPGGPKSRLT